MARPSRALTGYLWFERRVHRSRSESREQEPMRHNAPAAQRTCGTAALRETHTTSRVAERFVAFAEKQKSRASLHGFFVFLVETWGIEPQTSRVRF